MSVQFSETKYFPSPLPLAFTTQHRENESLGSRANTCFITQTNFARCVRAAKTKPLTRLGWPHRIYASCHWNIYGEMPGSHLADPLVSVCLHLTHAKVGKRTGRLWIVGGWVEGWHPQLTGETCNLGVLCELFVFVFIFFSVDLFFFGPQVFNAGDGG